MPPTFKKKPLSICGLSSYRVIISLIIFLFHLLLHRWYQFLQIFDRSQISNQCALLPPYFFLSFRCNETCLLKSGDFCCSLLPQDENFFNASASRNILFNLDWNVKYFILKSPHEIYSSNSWLVYYQVKSLSDFSVVENIKTDFKNMVRTFRVQ